MKRKVALSILFCLLLAVSGAIFCVSFGIWFSSHKAIVKIDDAITTVAIPNMIAIESAANRDTDYVIHYPETGPSPYEIRTDELIEKLRGSVYSSGHFKMDRRNFFGAYSPQVEAAPLRNQGAGMEVAVSEHMPQSTVALLLRCIAISESYDLIQEPQPDGAGIVYSFIKTSVSNFDIVSPLVLKANPSGEVVVPRYTKIAIEAKSPGLNLPTPGRHYVFTTENFTAQTFVGPSDGINRIISQTEKRLEVCGQINSMNDIIKLRLEHLLNYYHWVETYEGYYAYLSATIELTEKDFPIYIYEYVYVEKPVFEKGFNLIEVSVETADGQTVVSAENAAALKIVETAQIKSNSLQILSTDNPNSLLKLNQQREFLREGRTFTAREIKRGANVCLISAMLADHNGLKPGDKINLSFFPSELTRMRITGIVDAEEMRLATRTYWLPTIYTSETQMTPGVEYTIAGVYTLAQMVESGEYTITGNTVIVPHNSVSWLGKEFDGEQTAPLVVDALIIKNGGGVEARETMNAISDGFGELFLFYEQGYTQVMVALNSLRLSSSWVLALAVVGWGIAALIFIVYYAVRKRREASLLFAMGVEAKNRVKWVLVQCAVLIALSQALALCISLPVYGGILYYSSRTAERFAGTFRDSRLSDDDEAGVRKKVPVGEETLAITLMAAGQAFVLTAVSGYIALKSSKFDNGLERV